MNPVYYPFPPLVVREVNFSSIVGTPQSPPSDNTIIGILKEILLLYQ